jgi:hypothetical protein
LRVDEAVKKLIEW